MCVCVFVASSAFLVTLVCAFVVVHTCMCLCGVARASHGTWQIAVPVVSLGR